MKIWKIQINKTILRKKNKDTSWFYAILQIYRNKNSIVLAQKMRHVNQWNRSKSPKLNSHLYDQFIYDRVSSIYNGEKTDSNKFCWEKWTAVYKKNHIGLLTPYTQINLKWIKYFSIRSEIIKFLEENKPYSLWQS